MDRLIELREYRTHLQKADVRDDEAFRSLIKDGFRLLDMSDEDFAHQLDMSRPSVTRWRNGKNAPHPAMRPRVYRFLASRAAHSITKLEADSTPRSASSSFAPRAEKLAAKGR